MAAIHHLQLPGAPERLTVAVAAGECERRGVEPDALEHLIATMLPDRILLREPSGRPVMRGGGAHVSLSHAEGATALALGSCPVGIDIERVDHDLDATALDADLLGRRDYELLCKCEADRRNALFYRLWTLKEARLKQCGHSLASAALPHILRDERDAEALARGGRVGEHMATSWLDLAGASYCIAVCWSP